MADGTQGGGDGETTPREVPGPPGPQPGLGDTPPVESGSPASPLPDPGPPRGGATGPSRAEIMTEIQALPEKFLNGLKEAFPFPPNATPPAASSGQSQSSNNASSDNATPAEPATRKSLAHWWFN